MRKNIIILMAMILAVATWSLAVASETDPGDGSDETINYPPYIAMASAHPGVANPGDTIEVIAKVLDRNGQEDVRAVGAIFMRSDYVAFLEYDADREIWAGELVVPDNVPMGKYFLNILAVDEGYKFSNIYHVVLEIAPRAAHTKILLPTDGRVFPCEGRAPVFAWTFVKHARAYEIELTYGSPDQFRTFTVPAILNAFKINPVFWRFMAEGRYALRVRALFPNEVEPVEGPWSRPVAFAKKCNNADDPRRHLMGRVLSVDSGAEYLVITVPIRDPESGEATTKEVTVNLEEDTVIFRGNEQITLDEIQVEELVSIYGYVTEDTAGEKVFFAKIIRVLNDEGDEPGPDDKLDDDTLN